MNFKNVRGALLFSFLTLITELIVYNCDMTYPRHIKIKTQKSK